MPTGKYYWSRK